MSKKNSKKFAALVRAVRVLRAVCEIRENKSGASIVIALVLIVAIMFFTIGISSTAITALHTTSYSKKSLQAEYAAHSALELTREKISAIVTGSATGVDAQVFVKKVCLPGEQTPCATEKIDLDQSIYADYEVLTVDSAEDTKYADGSSRSVPVKKTGDARDGCGGLTMSDVESADHACNWNKIYYGDSISVPLYTVNVSGGGEVVLNPAPSGLNISSFKLKVRSPCSEGGDEANCERYNVLVDPEFGVTNGKVLLSWQIDGECDGGSRVCGVTYVLDTSAVQGGLFTNGVFAENLYVKEVMDLYELDGDGNLKKGPLSAFFNNSAIWTENALNKPIFRMSYVTPATSSNSPIPYLEYQIYYKSGSPLAASYRLNVDGYSEGFKYSLNGVQNLSSNLFNFAVQN